MSESSGYGSSNSSGNSLTPLGSAPTPVSTSPQATLGQSPNNGYQQQQHHMRQQQHQAVSIFPSFHFHLSFVGRFMCLHFHFPLAIHYLKKSFANFGKARIFLLKEKTAMFAQDKLNFERFALFIWFLTVLS